MIPPRAYVDHQTVAAVNETLLARNLARGQHEMAEQLLVLGGGRREAGHVHARNEQYVRGRLRRDVAEGQAGVVLVDGLGRDLAAKDFANWRGDGRSRCESNSQRNLGGKSNYIRILNNI